MINMKKHFYRIEIFAMLEVLLLCKVYRNILIKKDQLQDDDKKKKLREERPAE